MKKTVTIVVEVEGKNERDIEIKAFNISNRVKGEVKEIK